MADNDEKRNARNGGGELSSDSSMADNDHRQGFVHTFRLLSSDSSMADNDRAKWENRLGNPQVQIPLWPIMTG